jgi:acyl dehydratase
MTPTLPESGFWFDDVTVGQELVSNPVLLTIEDIRSFASQWDPLPIHLDDKAARAAGLEGITASGTHLLAIKNRLLYDFAMEQAVLASFGFDEVRFHAPARPRDTLHLRLTWKEKRPSRSRPDRGIARHLCELMRADGVVLLSLHDTILMRVRPT